MRPLSPLIVRRIGLTRFSERAFFNRIFFECGLSYVRSGARACVTFDIRDKLPRLRMPALVVHGTADMILPLSHGEALAKKLPDAQFQSIPGGDHVAVLNRWMELNLIIEDFLNALD